MEYTVLVMGKAVAQFSTFELTDKFCLNQSGIYRDTIIEAHAINHSFVARYRDARRVR